jgi:DNA-binding SARP family transcriptional activator
VRGFTRAFAGLPPAGGVVEECSDLDHAGRVDAVKLRLLGGFEVLVDGVSVPETAWSYGRAKDLVKLLALAPAHRLSRDQVVESMWPQLDPDAGVSNLHKAAHHARRALGDPAGVVLREGQVLLAPGARVETDVELFEQTPDPDRYGGELLPEDRYAEWAEERRERLRATYLEALRTAGLWDQLAGVDASDEEAQRAVMRGRLAAGDRAGALRAFERLRSALDELGLTPEVETLSLRARIAGGAAFHEALAAVEVALAESPARERGQLLATRADLLMALGDRGAPAAFAEAAAAAGGRGLGLRIRQAWAQLANGDAIAAQATLAPLSPQSDAERAAYLIARAAAAWFAGDAEQADRAASEAQRVAATGGFAVEARAAKQIQVMVAHSRGVWSDVLRVDLDSSLGSTDLAEMLFDGHLCVAEYALSSGEPHDRLRAVAEDLHAQAQHLGARRAQVLGATVLGEIALIAGHAADACVLLAEAVRVSREIGAVTAEGLASVRLGEAMRARGNVQEGNALIADGVLISAWSPMVGHIQPLAHAALLRATDEAALARERLEDAEAALRGTLVCAYCGTAFQVAAAIAAARATNAEAAAVYLAAAERGATMRSGGPWPAALDEARGELALARGAPDEAHARLNAARAVYLASGRQFDADRVVARIASLG